jgi:hypothetical protein
MKYVLIWWIVHPMHMQTVHMQGGFASEKMCVLRAAQIEQSTSKPVHWHCGKE